MRTNIILFTGMAMFLIHGSNLIHAQEAMPKRPAYLAVTNTHWNLDYEDFDMDTWKAVEQEYFDKVTSKNELIVLSGIYLHRFTPDNTEILIINGYESWADIDSVTSRSSELIKEGWPDEEARKAFFKKRNAYYANAHSDEIFSPMDFAKLHDRATTEILLVRRSSFSFPEDGSEEEFDAYFKEAAENIYHKNELIKGYYPNVHAWGSDGTEFVEGFYVSSMADLDAMFDKNEELYNAHWADEEAKKKFEMMERKYFTGKHGDFIYTVLPEFIKP